MMRQYHVGDTVFVKPDLVVGQGYEAEEGSGYFITLLLPMAKYTGAYHTIKRVHSTGMYYTLDVVENYWWTASMFEDDTPEEETIIPDDPSLLYGWG